jgi:hypothetical protein
MPSFAYDTLFTTLYCSNITTSVPIEHAERTDDKRAANLEMPLVTFQLLGISRRREFRATKACYSMGLNETKCNIIKE